MKIHGKKFYSKKIVRYNKSRKQNSAKFLQNKNRKESSETWKKEKMILPREVSWENC